MKILSILKKSIVSFVIVFILSSCAVTNFSTTDTPATISEEFIREGLATWKGTIIIGFNNSYLKSSPMGTTYTVDPGPINILVIYRESKEEIKIPAKFYDTYPITINAILKEGKSYRIKASTNSNNVKFYIIDNSNNQIIANSNETSIIYKSVDLPLESLIKK